MNFDPKSDNFYDFSIDDFFIENYNPIHPQLKLDLGIWGEKYGTIFLCGNGCNIYILFIDFYKYGISKSEISV